MKEYCRLLSATFADKADPCVHGFAVLKALEMFQSTNETAKRRSYSWHVAELVIKVLKNGKALSPLLHYWTSRFHACNHLRNAKTPNAADSSLGKSQSTSSWNDSSIDMASIDLSLMFAKLGTGNET